MGKTALFIIQIKNPRTTSGILLHWCAGEDLNLHVLRHTHLKRACLPIPAPAQIQSRAYYNLVHYVVKQGIFGNYGSACQAGFYG